MRGHALAISCLASAALSFAARGDTLPVNEIVAFGDSLTDTGNVSIVTQGADPGAGYAYRSLPGLSFQVGEYTNPPVAGGPSGLWIDQFAASAGLPDPSPSMAPGGGTNYAFAGADTTGAFGVSSQVGTYLSGQTSVPSTTLFTFWAGANDIPAGDNPVQAANDLMTDIETLAGDGGKYFLWFNLPLLGNTPRGIASGDAAALNAASIAFNTQWAADIQSLNISYPGIDLVGVDIGSLFQQILSTPGNDGFNVGATPPGGDPNDYLFSFDGLHPTSAADSLIADLALSDFEASVTPTSSVPEPTSMPLALFGLCLVSVAAYRIKLRFPG